MKTLLSDGGLEFKTIDKYNYSSEDIMLFNSTLETINAWGNPHVMENLNLNGLSKLGSVLRSEAFASDKDLYFVFDQQQLVATTLLLPSIELQHSDDLSYFIKHHNAPRFSKHATKNYMSPQKAQEILDNDGKNSCYIHYLVVNPELQGRGIGSEVIKTIESDINFFDQAPTHNALMAMIRNTNTPCINMFQKQGYETCPNDACLYFDMFYKTLET